MLQQNAQTTILILIWFSLKRSLICSVSNRIFLCNLMQSFRRWFEDSTTKLFFRFFIIKCFSFHNLHEERQDYKQLKTSPLYDPIVVTCLSLIKQTIYWPSKSKNRQNYERNWKTPSKRSPHNYSRTFIHSWKSIMELVKKFKK